MPSIQKRTPAQIVKAISRMSRATANRRRRLSRIEGNHATIRSNPFYRHMKIKHPDYPATFEYVARQLKHILEDANTYTLEPQAEGTSKTILLRLSEAKVSIEFCFWALESVLVYKDLNYFPREHSQYKRLRGHIKTILLKNKINYSGSELKLPENFVRQLDFLKEVVEYTFFENPNVLRNAQRNFGRNQFTRKVHPSVHPGLTMWEANLPV